jgi:hypothetical protein
MMFPQSNTSSFYRYAGIKLDNLTAPYVGPAVKAERTRKRAKQLRQALVSSGSVTFIKSGKHRIML